MENSTPQISVIVPVYNAEKYLVQCVDSILNQDFMDFELLLIDDGSKDQSGQICDAYARQDQRVRVFHKENGGVSSARNIGLDNAHGEYIAFIDSDDYVDNDYLSILMGGKTADLVVTGNQVCGSEQNCTSYENSQYTGSRLAIYFPFILNDANIRSPWDKLFRKDIIENKSIYFDTNISYAEDVVFVHTYLLFCRSVAFRSGTSYHYRITSSVSLLKYGISSQQYIYTLHQILGIYERLSKHFNCTSPKYVNETYKLILMQYLRGISKDAFTLKGYAEYKRTMRQYCPQGISFSDKLYRLCYRLLKMNLYFLSFFILRFIYPMKA